MAIRFLKDTQQFILNTKHTTYAFDVFLGRYLRHLYYGKRTKSIETVSLKSKGFSPSIEGYGYAHSPDTLPNEISFFGSGDFRATSLRLLGADGTGVTDFVYSSYRIFKGRRDICGLPNARADEKTYTLEITMLDSVTDCNLLLYYTVFEEYDVISRYMVVENKGGSAVKIENCMSAELVLDRCDLDMISFCGMYCRECRYQRVPLHRGIQSVCSRRGASSHQYNPFIALCSHKATEERGDAYGFNFVYSGSFLAEVEVDQTDRTKLTMGLGSECFSYTLNTGDIFESPEVIMTYTDKGIGQMSRNFHGFIRNNIMPKVALDPHPVVLNTWEACFFNIDENKLISFAKEAKKCGFDMLVMDDGWFGKRNNDSAGLGDWYENPDKFPRGLGAFVKDIQTEGINFGIWIEPEMINPDSELYRAHPEWCLRVEGREPLLSRKQLVLDMSNEKVIEYLMDIFAKTFDGIKIDYFKWDMNRHLSNVGSSALPADRQGEVLFRYMKGVYRLLDWFSEKFPDAVIETCSGGGGRYDLGMMAYGIQIWTSDSTNPYNRTYIQHDAMTAYPATTMSCHVSNPKGDMRCLDYKYKTALGGMLGYELNILDMSDEIKAEITKQISEYKQIDSVIRLGDYYSLASPLKYDYSAYYYSHGDTILLTVIEKDECKADKTKLLKIKAADVNAEYVDIRAGKRFLGKDLKNGISVPLTREKYSAHLLILKKS